MESSALRRVNGLRKLEYHHAVKTHELMLLMYRSGLSFIFWYSYKGEIRRYLHDLNKDKKVQVKFCTAHMSTESY